MKKNKLLSLGLIIIIYIISAAGSYVLFSDSSSAKNIPPISGTSGKLTFNTTLPKTEPCPMNGELYSKQQKDWWETHRPLGVMVENHEDARPQSGLSYADVVYEAVAEGSITRFLAIFYCQDAEVIGPVRSARTYFMDFVSEYGQNPLYTHVGGANTPGPANALGQIEDYGWGLYNDLSQFSSDLAYPIMVRDETRQGHPVATEHTVYSSTTKLWNVAKNKRGLSNVDKEGSSWTEGFVPYTFKEDAVAAQRPALQSIHIEPWEEFKQYAIDWTYDPLTNLYKRNNGGKPHIDRNTNKQITTKNIVILTMVETHANDGYEGNVHLLYKTKGSGKANIFMDGKQTKGTWRKDTRISRTLLFDESGVPIKFDKGTIWFEILPTDGILTVK
ncbi:MAG: DUF3048 domain-containing protein [bacterium]|nr:DUF3048 domain-containing protein [bacterium]